METVTGRLWKILLVGGNQDEAVRLEVALAGVDATRASVDCASVVRASERLSADSYDIVFVDLDALGEQGMAALCGLRACAPSTPLLAIARDADETLAIDVLQAGAQDCLTADDIGGAALVRAVRHAIERNRFQRRLEDMIEQDARERGLMEMRVLGGPPPLVVTQRCLGAFALQERAPREFAQLVREYGSLLDRALLGRSPQEQEQASDALNGLADRLGALGAGPRDAIDLHRATMSERLEIKSPGKSKAYVEEGRLLLLQLMGYLVAFYRNMSWGQGVSLKRSERLSQPLPEQPGARGK